MTSPGRFAVLLLLAALPGALRAQSPQTPSSSSATHAKRAPAKEDSALDPGSVANNLYRNKTLAFTCKIPEGWVLRTEELNARDEAPPAADEKAASSAGAKVLLAAFSRPPEARGEEVNSSILIAAESISSYPGLKEPIQYIGTLTEVAKAQGFTADEEPYEVAVDTKTMIRADFHKDVGTRVMRQSTMAMLAHGYAISITVIAGTEDDLEELIDGLTFAGTAKPAP